MLLFIETARQNTATICYQTLCLKKRVEVNTPNTVYTQN